MDRFDGRSPRCALGVPGPLDVREREGVVLLVVTA